MYVTVAIPPIDGSFVVAIRNDQEWVEFSGVLRKLLQKGIETKLAYNGPFVEPVEGKRSGMLVLSVSSFEHTMRTWTTTETDRAIFGK